MGERLSLNDYEIRIKECKETANAELQANSYEQLIAVYNELFSDFQPIISPETSMDEAADSVNSEEDKTEEDEIAVREPSSESQSIESDDDSEESEHYREGTENGFSEEVLPYNIEALYPLKNKLQELREYVLSGWLSVVLRKAAIDALGTQEGDTFYALIYHIADYVDEKSALGYNVMHLRLILKYFFDDFQGTIPENLLPIPLERMTVDEVIKAAIPLPFDLLENVARVYSTVTKEPISKDEIKIDQIEKIFRTPVKKFINKLIKKNNIKDEYDTTLDECSRDKFIKDVIKSERCANHIKGKIKKINETSQAEAKNEVIDNIVTYCAKQALRREIGNFVEKTSNVSDLNNLKNNIGSIFDEMLKSVGNDKVKESLENSKDLIITKMNNLLDNYREDGNQPDFQDGKFREKLTKELCQNLGIGISGRSSGTNPDSSWERYKKGLRDFWTVILKYDSSFIFEE